MKTKITYYLTFVFVFLMHVALAQAQTKTISGVVTDNNGLPIPGVNISVLGTNQGAVTDFDGEYSIQAAEGQQLLFTIVGYEDQLITVGSSSNIDVSLNQGSVLDEVVVTALGVSREKRSLGYATQEVTSEDLNRVPTTNFVNALSGKVSGIDIRRNNNFGGSTNVVIRGNTSITGNNQALFVIDGVPISNANTNTSAQAQASGTHFDYGNAAMDIDPEDIESVNVLKGAAASALYGSRASNGVVIITTKKGKKRAGLGVTINSGVEVGSIDRSTFPTYQKLYGGGYDGEAFIIGGADVDGDGVDDLVSNFTEDASYGPSYDPNLMLYQWDAFDPASPNYLKKTPWIYPKHGPIDFFETPVTLTNSISISNGGDNGVYRLSYNKRDLEGMMPNSKMNRNDFRFSGAYDVSDKFHVSGTANYIKTDTRGRNSTGYSDNIMGMFRQWWQTNVDLRQQRDIYNATGRNVSWNPNSTAPGALPLFWDNPYWARYENYQNDSRNRFIGKFEASYDVTDWLNILGRVGTDTYSEIQEERRAVGSVPDLFGVTRGNVDSGYMRANITNYETNYDLMANVKTDITEKLNFMGLLGVNVRRSEFNLLRASTAGGLLIPGLYSLKNGRDAAPNPVETLQKEGVDGVYGSVSFGYDRMLYLDATLRRDKASTLPEDNNTFWYPSVSGSFVFSQLLNSHSTLNYGKFRVNYAEVGNGAPVDRILDTYNVNSDIGTSLPITHNNPDLKPERQKSFEVGLELQFFSNRLGVDAAYYTVDQEDQIVAADISTSSGYSSMLLNAGKVRNEGVELAVNLNPVRTDDWNWNLGVNWTKNKNRVLELPEGVNTIQLGRFQGGVSIHASKEHAYGAIHGTDFIYDEDTGEKVVGASGNYLRTSSSNNVIGNIQPDWLMGITNSVSWKDLSLSFLIDIKKGGDVWILDQNYGQATGIYAESAALNDLGNPVRNPLDEGGGFINPGVKEDGTPNDVRVDASEFGSMGYAAYPNKEFVYDAGFVKLREVALTYSLPNRLLANTFLTGVQFSVTGSNLWIIHKNTPYTDPESGLGSGNMAGGYITGALPTVKRYGFNVRLQF